MEYNAQNGKIINTNNYILTILMALFFGGLGIHRFINGKIGTGILMIVTLGGFGIWSFIDCLMILTNNFKNDKGEIVGYEGSFTSNGINIFVVIIMFFDIILTIVFFMFLFLVMTVGLFSFII